MTESFEDLSQRPLGQRKHLAHERWIALPRAILELFEFAPKLALYRVLAKMGVDAKPSRAVEWAYVTRSGELIVTIWHDHMDCRDDGSVAYYIPIANWRGVGVQQARADELGRLLAAYEGQKVKALLLEHAWDAQDTQYSKRCVADIRTWRVERLAEGEFVLRRGTVPRVA